MFNLINKYTTAWINLANMALNLVDLYQNRNKILVNWEVEIITLLPGDML